MDTCGSVTPRVLHTSSFSEQGEATWELWLPCWAPGKFGREVCTSGVGWW